MDLEVQDLKLVRAIVDDGGLARASERLHLTPSALSHRLADLERRVGVPLFARIGRRLLPTPTGEALLLAAPRVLAAVDELEAGLRRLAGRRVTALRVATECYTCYHWLPDVLAHFEREHPEVQVRVVLPATRRAVRSLVEGELDLAIADERPSDPRLVPHALFTSEFVAVVAPSHPWAARPFVRAADFATERLLRYPMPREHSTLLTEILGPAGVVPEVEETVELTEALLELVRAGRGVAALASWMVAPRVARGELVAVPIRETAAKRRWYAVVRRQPRPDPQLAAFVRALRKVELPGAAPLETEPPAQPPASPREEPAAARGRSSAARGRRPRAAARRLDGRGA
jgi:LysR family transcriptional regulator for metE and metH